MQQETMMDDGMRDKTGKAVRNINIGTDDLSDERNFWSFWHWGLIIIIRNCDVAKLSSTDATNPSVKSMMNASGAEFSPAFPNRTAVVVQEKMCFFIPVNLVVRNDAFHW